MSASPLYLRSAGLPEPWRPVDRLLHRWVRAHGGDEALARLAGAISAAEGDGHTALAADDAERYGARWPDATQCAAWRASGWLGERDGDAPFVMDAGLRLYLRRHARAEAAIAARLAALASTAMTSTAMTTTPHAPLDLDALFGGSGDGRDAAQREAVRRASMSALFVLTGGPGTGKTTTVLRMLLALLARRAEAPRVAVAAPTGKAAQRLVQALRDGSAALTDALAEHPTWAPTLARFRVPEATTAHRLLGFHPRRHAFAHDARHPLALDLLVVDEASMLALALLRALCAALPPHAALWLVGDADQLSPVGPGSALQDLVQAFEAREGAPLQRLVHGFRASSAPGALNAAVLAGDAAALRAAFAESPSALRWHDAPTEASLRDALDAWADALLAEGRAAALLAEGRAAALLAEGRAAALLADTIEPAGLARAALDALRDRQWLCALRQGPRGSEAANARIDARLRRAAERDGLPVQDAFYPGRRLLVTRNDPDTGLFNGDVGVVLAEADGRLRAWFDGSDGPRAVLLGALPPHEPAFALSIHKSQGSEYGHVAVLLPDDAQHRLLSRELLYTATSRARRALDLHAAPEVVDAALAHRVKRMGGLHDRLAESLPPR